MARLDEIDRLGIDQYLAQYQSKSLLRFLTCGSVDDGKSTLIGRLLYDAGAVFEDQLESARRDSRKFGTTGEELDYALLIDGLSAEREQGITIDVAYRYFNTTRRKFIIADTPGHEQYTRNMATGASTADLAIILVDARNGVLDQTRRHAFIASLLGIRHIVVTINKMDLVDYDRGVFEQVRADFMDFAAKLQVPDLHFIPVSALRGDNIVRRSDRMPWFQGSTLLDLLETVHIASDRNLIDLRFAIQLVMRPDLDFRGYAGNMLSGVLRPGDEVVALPSGRRSRVKRIVTFDGELSAAFSPQAITVQLTDELDISRGDMLASPNNAPILSQQLEAMLVWLDSEPLDCGRSYLLKHTSNLTAASIDTVRYRMNINSLHREPSAGLALNEIGRVALTSSRPLACDAYHKNRATGAFILIDRLSNATVAAGMILDSTPSERILARRHRAADAGSNLRPQHGSLTPAVRAARLDQQPFTLWLTGLPRAGKSSLAFALEAELCGHGYHVHVLDGENLRLGINADLGFSPQDRWENQRRAAEIARMCNDLGLITIVALASPLTADRAQARRIIGEDRFLEIYCEASLEVCEQRDEDGLYARARAGEIGNVTGIDAPYEPPQAADQVLDTAAHSVNSNVAALLDMLSSHGLLKRKVN